MSSGYGMFSFLIPNSGQTGSFVARIERMRRAGYIRGRDEAELFLRGVGKGFRHHQAVTWINAAIEEGRNELQAQRAIEREINAWDMSCRIMFMVVIAEGFGSG
jgi:hypothetical protein